MRLTAILLYCAISQATSFQTTHQPKTRRHSLLQRQVGLSHPVSDFPSSEYGAKERVKPDETTATAESKLSPLQSLWTKYGMIAFVSHMCVFLPMALLPTYIQTRLGLLTKAESEHQALQVGQSCARRTLNWIPFMNLNIVPHVEDNPQPTIWVSNHVSMLDTFVFLAADEELRGRNRRPVKTLYWKGLDSNPIVKLLFNMAGFMSVDMADNGNGNPNEYNRASFKKMLKDTQKAVEDGFDILIFPEGQLNPRPEKGLQPVLPGAYGVAKSSHRPIQMIASHGCHNLWHADESIGMTVVGKDVTIRAYPPGKREYHSAEEFTQAFSAIVGTFGSTGQDLPDEELDYWLNGQVVGR